MAHLQFQPFPDVGPRPAPPEDYQNIPTNPREFGAQVGAGEERLGAGVSAAGKQFGEIAADEQVNHVLTGLDDLTTQYQSLKGRDALDQQQTTRKSMADLLAKARGNLSTLDQQLDFDRQTRYLYSRADREVGAHADQQQQVWGLGVNKSAADLALNGAARSAASGDMNAAANFTSDAINARMKAAQLTYGMDLSPEIRANVEREARADSARGQIMGMLPTNPTGAKQILDANAQNFTGLEYETLSQHLKTGVTDQEAQQFVMGSPGPGQPGEWRAPPGQLVAGANPDEQRFLNEARYRESSGNYEAVNPKSGTTGAYQFKDQTWKEAAAGTGVGAEFAHAKDAPPSVQDANALWLYRNRGAAPWANSGPYPGAAQTAHLTASSPQVTSDDRQTPGLSSEIDRIYSSDLTPEAKNKAAELARLKYTSEWTDQTRAHELQARQQKDASDAAENQIIADAASTNPQISAQQIANNPSLTPEAKLRMVNFLAAGARREVTPAASQRESMALLDDMRKPAGDPTRVSDMNPIVDAYTQGKLTREDFSFLQTQFNNVRAPDGDKLASVERDFLKGMQSSITKSNPLMGQLDREGDRKLYEFNWMVSQRVAQARREGKNPFDLFDPAKPDYLGKPEALRPYQTTTQQSSQSIADALSQQGTAVPIPPAAPTALPRQPGKSIADYMKRAGIAMPTMPAPAMAAPAGPAAPIARP